MNDGSRAEGVGPYKSGIKIAELLEPFRARGCQQRSCSHPLFNEMSRLAGLGIWIWLLGTTGKPRLTRRTYLRQRARCAALS